MDGSKTSTFGPSEPPPGSGEPVGVGDGEVGVGETGPVAVRTMNSHSE
jgi:hypothetical protein